MSGETQQILTRSFRQLERDGLVKCQDYNEVPPRVDYESSELGRGLLARVTPLWTWVAENREGFRDARILYDFDISSDTT